MATLARPGQPPHRLGARPHAEVGGLDVVVRPATGVQPVQAAQHARAWLRFGVSVWVRVGVGGRIGVGVGVRVGVGVGARVRSSKPAPRRNALAASSPVPALAAHQRASTDGPSSCTTRTRGSKRCSERCSKRVSKRVSRGSVRGPVRGAVRGSVRGAVRGADREALRGGAGHLHHEHLAVGAQHLLTAVVQRPGEAWRAVPAVVHRLTSTCIPQS